MCGVAGIVQRSGFSLELLVELASTLRHRGPDDEGYVAEDANRLLRSFRGDETVPELGDLRHWRAATDGSYCVGLCHRRLSILDLSPAGHQPMLSPDGNLALVFGGEIYNYLELADELERLGWKLRPCGDTAVLLAAFAEWGPACVDRLRGMWAFAVYDRRSERLTLSRDRFGIKPVYYTCRNGRFAFSSEIKGLLPVLEGKPRGSAREVARLLAWGRAEDQASTLFEDIRALPPGCNLHVSTRDLSVRVERYYDVDAATTGGFDGDLNAAIEEYRQRLDVSVQLHMRSDVSVGSCLSGGLDSNLTAALATTHLQDGRLSTFTAAFDNPGFDESRYVHLHAVRSGRFETHFAFPTATSLLAEMDRLVWAQDQPLASASPFAQWAVMQSASERGIKVLLDGQGADEAIGGYSYFAGVHLLELLRARKIGSALRDVRSLRDRRGISVLRELGRAAYYQLPAAFRASARRSTRTGHQLVSRDYLELIGQAPEASPRTFRDYSVSAIHHSLPELLRYEDRSSMAFSIESRVPFLDHPLVEFVLALPTQHKMHEGWSKFVQRKAGEPLLPAEIVWRRDKLGFVTPQKEWKRALTAPLTEYLRSIEVPTFLDRTRLTQLVSDSADSSVGLSEFWRAIFLLKWVEVFQVQFSAS